MYLHDIPLVFGWICLTGAVSSSKGKLQQVPLTLFLGFRGRNWHPESQGPLPPPGSSFAEPSSEQLLLLTVANGVRGY